MLLQIICPRECVFFSPLLKSCASEVILIIDDVRTSLGPCRGDHHRRPPGGELRGGRPEVQGEDHAAAGLLQETRLFQSAQVGFTQRSLDFSPPGETSALDPLTWGLENVHVSVAPVP